MGLSIFTWADLAVIIGFFSISIIVGLYHYWHSRRKLIRESRNRRTKTDEGTEDAQLTEYLLGGRKLPILPTTLSLVTSFLSGVLLLGVPADVYIKGFFFPFYFLGGLISFIIIGLLFVPTFHQLQLTTLYEYFEWRFQSRLLRQLNAVLFLISALIYSAIVLYAPSITISSVTGAPLWALVLVCGTVCTLYTAVGGIKAVIWTDALQATVMYIGIGTLVVKGTIDAGGTSHILDTAWRSGRFNVFTNLDLNPAQYNSIWISVGGGIFFYMSSYGLNQMALQRYCSVPTVRQAQTILALSGPGFFSLGLLASLIGLIMLAYNKTCDPVAKGRATTKDQFVVLFAIDILQPLPGFLGIFMATIFSCTLSTISSSINSMSAVIWNDLIVPSRPNISDSRAAQINRFMVLVCGLVSTLLTFICPAMSGLIRAATLLLGALTSPVSGLFLLGFLVPWSNRRGASLAFLIACVVMATLTAGQIIYQPYSQYKLAPMYEQDCNNTVLSSNATVTHDVYGNLDVPWIFRFSSFAFPPVSVTIVLLFGSVFSWLLPVRTNVSNASQTRNAVLTEQKMKFIQEADGTADQKIYAETGM